MHLDENTLREEGIEAQKIAEPWMKTPIDWQKIKSVCPVITCIFSDDDPYVPLSDEIIFRDNLEARIVVLKSRGHFTDEDGDKAWSNIIKEFDRISSN